VAVLTALAPNADRDRTAITRRQLLAWGATASVAVTLRGLAAAPQSVATEPLLRRASYVGRVGQSFYAAQGGATTVSLRLLAVDDLIGTTPRGASLAGLDDAFLLEFRGPSTPRLSQGVYQLHHQAIGHIRLFLVPQAPGGHGNTYAVVINRADR
jgi:hypothetical protein